MTPRASSAWLTGPPGRRPHVDQQEVAADGSGREPEREQARSTRPRSALTSATRRASCPSVSARLATAATWASPLTSNALRTRREEGDQIRWPDQVPDPEPGEAVRLGEGARHDQPTAVADQRHAVVAAGGQVLEVGLVDGRQHVPGQPHR